MQKRLKEKRLIGKKNIGPEHPSSVCMFLSCERVNLLLQAPRKETMLPPTHYHQPIWPAFMLVYATMKMYPACLATVSVTSAGRSSLFIYRCSCTTSPRALSAGSDQGAVHDDGGWTAYLKTSQSSTSPSQRQFVSPSIASTGEPFFVV